MKPTDMHDKYNMTRVKNKKINTTLCNFGKIDYLDVSVVRNETIV